MKAVAKHGNLVLFTNLWKINFFNFILMMSVSVKHVTVNGTIGCLGSVYIFAVRQDTYCKRKRRVIFSKSIK